MVKMMLFKRFIQALVLLILPILLFSACKEESTLKEDSSIGKVEHLVEYDTNNSGALQVLNFLRTSVGLSALQENTFLNKASLNHSKYQSINKEIAHEEFIDKEGFTGLYAPYRAVSIGYPTFFVSENIATAESEYNAIRGLFTAIYHRFSFLDFTIDEVGMGKASYNFGYDVYTFNMGIKKLSELCLTDQYSGEEYYYSNICANNVDQDKSKFDAVLDSYYTATPNFIVYPYYNAVEVSPAFYSEVPDPLPNRFMTGNPISVEFNPKWYETNVSVHTFTLQNLSTNEFIDYIELNQNSDPHYHLTALQYAFFPVKRLDYNTTYQATIIYEAPFTNGIATHQWAFTTKSYDNLLTVKNSGDTFYVKADVLYTLYFDSNENASLLESSELKSYSAKAFSPESTIQARAIDSMTYLIKLKGVTNDHFQVFNNALDNGNTFVNIYIQ